MRSPRFTNPARVALALLGLAAVLASSSRLVFAQQSVPFQGSIPLAPTGLAGKPLGAGPFVYDTGEGERIRVVVVTRALTYPTSLAFLPDGGMLIGERFGNVRIIRNGVLDPQPVAGVPDSYGTGESGLPGAVHGIMEVVLHPRFAENRLVYVLYTKALDEKRRTVAISRSEWDGKALTGTKDIFVATERTGSSRMAFGSDGMLYVATSGGDAQDPGSHGGKTLRLRDDGTVPPDNPFASRAGYRPEIYTKGHRSSLGLAVHPATGAMWQHENGPNGGDEINILKPGANYGWPFVSYGRTYPGPWQSEDRPGHAVFEPPVVIWVPSIAASGLAFYTGDRFPKWKGDVFVGSLRTGEIPGTGHIERILFNEKMEELRREALLTDLRQRMRDIRQGPDGLLYVLTDEKEGALLRIEPAQGES